uniref:Transmembrane protein n=1 Tax=Ralstonia solanacearum TaxID=305 RepID=A0A0S4U656_RALSL|nr:protein of unknown function [Ralstonia solanacearum]
MSPMSLIGASTYPKINPMARTKLVMQTEIHASPSIVLVVDFMYAVTLMCSLIFVMNATKNRFN